MRRASQLSFLLATFGVQMSEVTSAEPLEFLGELRENESLIRTIHAMFGERDRLRSADICSKLGLDPVDLGERLRPCNITSATIKFTTDTTYRGFCKVPFENAVRLLDAMAAHHQPQPSPSHAPPDPQPEAETLTEHERDLLCARYLPKRRDGWNFGNHLIGHRHGRFKREWQGI